MGKAKKASSPGDLDKTPELLSLAKDGERFILDGRLFMFEVSNALCWLTEETPTGAFTNSPIDDTADPAVYGRYYKHVRTIDPSDQTIPGFAAHELLELIRIIALKRYIIV